ncbi:MAG: ATP-binding cassette domain-containing protein [Planctomycetota bacterium]
MITLEDISIRYRGPHLLDGVSARIHPNDRIGLLGRNGAGKTTLLKILSDQIPPDHGRVIADRSVRIAQLIQDVPGDTGSTVIEMVRAGQSGVLHRGTDHRESWHVDQIVDETLTRMSLPASAPFESLSSGMKRRVLLAQAIAAEPDVLLLDEPTNHLDITSILWLEDFLKRWQGTLVFITHDRAFLQSLASRIWEIDRGNLFDWTCDYPTFLKRKELAYQAEEKQNALFDKRLAEEEAWIRRGIKARRTRNEGRVRALKAMREERSQRRTKEKTAKLNLQDAARGGALIAKLDDVSFSYDHQPIVRNLNLQIMRGDKIGIIGRNGAGKSTLLKLILGQLGATSGTIKLGTNLKIAYFDQLRDTLDPDATVEANVSEGADRVEVGGKAKHIIGYLQDYLFTPERSRTLVKHLSGGEQNRVLLAKLMTKPANVIVLDEPTNDLDAETLELLEEQLTLFDGTVLMVSHDRAFLNQIVTSTLAFDDDAPDGTVIETVGGYDAWGAVQAQRRSQAVAAKPKPASSSTRVAKSTASNASTTNKPKQKLSFNEQRELDQLPSQIEALENEMESLTAKMSDPEFYKSESGQIADVTAQLKQCESDLATAYQRWELLEEGSR